MRSAKIKPRIIVAINEPRDCPRKGMQLFRFFTWILKITKPKYSFLNYYLWYILIEREREAAVLLGPRFISCPEFWTCPCSACPLWTSRLLFLYSLCKKIQVKNYIDKFTVGTFRWDMYNFVHNCVKHWYPHRKNSYHQRERETKRRKGSYSCPCQLETGGGTGLVRVHVTPPPHS